MPINSAGTVDRGKERRLVTVYFHSKRYAGKCKLIALNPRPGTPSEWTSAEITQGSESNIWGAAFAEEDIPKGDYLLEVPLAGQDGKSRKIRQRIQLDHAYQDIVGVSGNSATFTDGIERILHEPLIGDGYSLEEAFLRLFNYKYVDSIGDLLKSVTPQGGAGGGNGKGSTAFATMLGVTKALHDRAAAALGFLSLNNSYFKNFAKIRSMVQEMPRSWKGLAQKSANIFIGEGGEAAHERMVKRWGLKDWSEEVEKWNKPVEVLGKILETYEQGAKVVEFIESFSAAKKAEEQYLSGVGENFRNRIETPKFQDFFSRGELIQLEALRQEADNRAGEAQNQGVGFTADMVGLAIGVIFPEGFIKSILGEKFAKVIDVIGWIKSGLEEFDEWAFNSTIANRYRDLSEWWHDSSAYTHLDNAIFHTLVGRSHHSWEQCEYSLQFLYRTKVLYGLMKLIGDCGSFEKDPGVFRKKVAELRIQEYLNRFLWGGPFWVRNNHLTVDWVQHFHVESNQEFRRQVICFEAPTDGGASNESNSSITWNQWGEHGWTKVDFQRWFPIHFMDHPDAASFAEVFSTDYSSVSEKHVETTFWQYASEVTVTEAKRPDGTVENVNEEITAWKVLEHGDIIDSEMPVRAVIVLKKNAPVRTGTPAMVQLKRVDWGNVNGPTYKSVVRRLSDKDLLPDSVVDATSRKRISGLEDRKGVIVEFDYAYTWKGHAPSKIYSGLKPLKGSSHSLIAQNMMMSAWWTLGRNEAQDWIANGKEIRLIPFDASKSRDFNRRNSDKFTDKDFLTRDTATETFNYAIAKSDVKTVLQVGEGSGKWRTLSPDDKVVVQFDQPVRVILRIRQRPHHSPGMPAAVQLVRTDSSNVPGPVYRAEKMFALDPFGFKGEWGTVIELYHYYVGLEEETFNIQKVNGIKPISNCTISHHNEISYKGFTFDLNYRVGDSWGSSIWESWSEYETAKPDDIPFDIGEYAKVYITGTSIDLSFVMSDDSPGKKLVLNNVPQQKRNDIIRNLAKDKLIHPDLLTEEKL
jgi:hypothetical protein